MFTLFQEVSKPEECKGVSYRERTSIGLELRRFRQSLGLNRKDMAARYSISVRTLKRWEDLVTVTRGPNLFEDRKLLDDFYRWQFSSTVPQKKRNARNAL